MKKLIQFSTLIDIYESLEILPDIEIRFDENDRFRELEYMSISPLHGIADMVIQLEGQPYTYWDRERIVEIREIVR